MGQPVPYIEPMPTIIRFSNIAISIYPRDHNPPHFHIRGPDFELLVEIETGCIVGTAGKARDVSEALKWAEANTALLLAEWQRLNQ